MDKNKLDINDISLDEDYFERIEKGIITNEILATYCDILAKRKDNEEDKRKWRLKAMDYRYCHKTLLWNHYEKQYLKDYQRTFKCHDKFCPLCAKDIANKREQKFYQALEDISNNYDLYHLVLTIPLCKGDIPSFKINSTPPNILELPSLEDNIKKMAKCYYKFIRYFKGHSKVSDIDFLQYGYAGSIRSLEITYKDNQTYHSHYHVILALKKDLILPMTKCYGNNTNKFSWDKYTKDYHEFTDLEILMQKIWYLIINDKKVTKESIINLSLGYSCFMRKVDKDNCHEAFKYAVKPDEQSIMSIRVYEDLYNALYKKRAVEAYGVFRKYKFNLEEIDETFSKFYDDLKEAWQQVESPVMVTESASESRNNIKKRLYRYVSRKSIRRYIRQLGIDEELPAIIASPRFEQLIMDLSSLVIQPEHKPKKLTLADKRQKSKNNKK